MSDYYILLINNGLMRSEKMTREQAKQYIADHPDFPYKAAAL